MTRLKCKNINMKKQTSRMKLIILELILEWVVCEQLLSICEEKASYLITWNNCDHSAVSQEDSGLDFIKLKCCINMKCPCKWNIDAETVSAQYFTHSGCIDLWL